ncbi:MAG: ATP-grasp domain-containing protein [Desulfovibrionaceae bacterium]|nr:ATP-grasp domain-containing protein [Desulfovibrionaceae bacterium]
MFVLDHPYVSGSLIESVKRLGLPVLDTANARALTRGADLEFIDEIEFSARMGLGARVYTNSENGLEYILRCRCNEDLARQVDVCKDKALFRETVAPLHPGYRFLRVPIDELADLDVSFFDGPFIVKPARGFFSLGVHQVASHDGWPDVVDAILAERDALNAEYPEGVVSAAEFLVEDGIEGEEYAIDVYFGSDGTPVITNILHHYFLSGDDVSDRLYYTSSRIIRQWLEPFTDYAARVGRRCRFRDFPIHLEVRVMHSGEILPIEANPLRFAGWCVADMTRLAWGVDPYECYFKGIAPDWEAILEGREGEVTTMTIADVPPGMDRADITGFDVEGFKSMFDNMLELREIDYSTYPVFAFCFARMDEAGVAALKTALKRDFSRFVTLGGRSGPPSA